MKIHLNLGKWSYEVEQNEESGQLEVLRRAPIGLLEKAVQYAKAEASGLVGSVALPVIEARKAVCEGCDSLKKVDDQTWYCKSCGCPEWERSRLQLKWEMPKATCPFHKWTE